MYGITDLKVGTVFEFDSDPYVVLESQHSKMGRGGAVLKSKIKNLANGVIVSKTFRGGEKFNPVNISRKKAQFLYYEGKKYFFMDQENYEQLSLKRDFIGNAEKFLIEGETYQLQLFESRILAIDLPVKMDFIVTDAEKGLKGDTASGATKVVKIETGLRVNVPLFIKKGDRIRVDTRNGSYVERAK